MEIIFTIIGFIILGLIVRALAGDKSVEPKPKNSSDWVWQLLLSLIVGAIVWAVIPKNCGNDKYGDDNPYDYQRLSRD